MEKGSSESQSIWLQFDEALRKENAGVLPKKVDRHFNWVVPAIVPLALCLAASIVILLPLSLSTNARLAAWVFAIAVILWSTTRLNIAFVALASLIFLVVTGVAPKENLFQSLASDVVWLMFGAFVLAEAIQVTGLAARLTSLVVRRSRTVKGIFWQLTFALIFLTFFIPSTSGRAAVMLPLFNSISQTANDNRISRALSLLISSVILVLTICTLVGAGSHLIANDLLQQGSGKSISFLQWFIYGFPFGVVAAFISCLVILRMFLKKSTRNKVLSIQPENRKEPLKIAEKKTLIVAAIMVLLWTTESLHGIDIAVTAVFGAVTLMLPSFGVLSWQRGLKSVSWNLLIFIGAALMLGQSLIDSGAAKWIMDNLFTFTGITSAKSTLLVLVLLCFISLTSHIYITSHTARAAALVPGLLYLAHSLNVDPVAVIFIGTVGMDYCLTFPVSSKALLIFQDSEVETFQPADLLRLSSVMLTVHFFLMLIFYFTYWRWLGLQFYH